MSETNFLLVKGTAYYAMVLGKARPNYERTGTEWTLDFVPADEAEAAKLKAAGIGDRVKEVKDGHPAGDGVKAIRLRRKGEDKDGNPKKGPVVVDNVQKDWPEDKLIGNGSKVFVKLAVTPPRTKAFKASCTLTGVMVKEYVPYEGGGKGMFDEVADEEAAAGGEEPW